MAADIDLSGTCDFLMTTLSGMKIARKGGATVEQLASIALFAIRVCARKSNYRIGAPNRFKRGIQ